MDSLANDYAAGLLTSHEPPCLSLYQPSHLGEHEFVFTMSG